MSRGKRKGELVGLKLDEKGNRERGREL